MINKKVKILENMIKRIVTEERITLKENYTKVVKQTGIDPSKIPDDEQYHKLLDTNIDPSKLGLFSLPFKSIKLTVQGGRIKPNARFPNGLIELSFRYSYEHPSGSNGYSHRIFSKDNGKTWVDYEGLR